jgi:hypothetical protein
LHTTPAVNKVTVSAAANENDDTAEGEEEDEEEDAGEEEDDAEEDWFPEEKLDWRLLIRWNVHARSISASLGASIGAPATARVGKRRPQNAARSSGSRYGACCHRRERRRRREQEQ